MNMNKSTETNDNLLNGTDKIADMETNNKNNTDKPEEVVGETVNLAEELLALQDTHLRLRAEYDNYRKRTLKEKADLIKNGGENILVGLLPIVDDFERALTVKASDEISQAIVDGVQLIYNKLLSFLNQNGVKAIETDNKEFDAELFDAIATIPAPTEELKGKVVDCVQKGYTLHDKVLRYAKVVVGE